MQKLYDCVLAISLVGTMFRDARENEEKIEKGFVPLLTIQWQRCELIIAV
jgi:hypothetical protein